MSNVPNVGCGDLIDYSDLIDEDPPPSTQRTPGSASLVVHDRCEPLFISATWTLEAHVVRADGTHTLIDTSSPSATARTVNEIKRWSRHLMKRKKSQLWKLGVDVGKAYALCDGDPLDLEDVG